MQEMAIPVDADKLRKLTSFIGNNKTPSSFIDFSKFAKENFDKTVYQNDTFNKTSKSNKDSTLKENVEGYKDSDFLGPSHQSRFLKEPIHINSLTDCLSDSSTDTGRHHHSKKSNRTKHLYREVQRSSLFLGVTPEEMRKFHELSMNPSKAIHKDGGLKETNLTLGQNHKNCEITTEQSFDLFITPKGRAETTNPQKLENLIEPTILSATAAVSPSSQVPVIPKEPNSKSYGTSKKAWAKYSNKEIISTSKSQEDAPPGRKSVLGVAIKTTDGENYSPMRKSFRGTSFRNPRGNDVTEVHHSQLSQSKSPSSLTHKDPKSKLSLHELPDEQTVHESTNQQKSSQKSPKETPIVSTPLSMSIDDTSKQNLSSVRRGNSFASFIKTSPKRANGKNLFPSGSFIKRSSSTNSTSSRSSYASQAPTQKECHSVEDTLLADEEFKDYSIPARSTSYYSNSSIEHGIETPSGGSRQSPPSSTSSRSSQSVFFTPTRSSPGLIHDIYKARTPPLSLRAPILPLSPTYNSDGSNTKMNLINSTNKLSSFHHLRTQSEGDGDRMMRGSSPHSLSSPYRGSPLQQGSISEDIIDEYSKF